MLQVLYTSTITVFLRTTDVTPPQGRTIYYIVKDPGSDWLSTTEPPVRQAQYSCPYWSCGAACPQGCRCPRGCDSCSGEDDYPVQPQCSARSIEPAEMVGGLNDVDTRMTTWTEEQFPNSPTLTYKNLISSDVVNQDDGSLESTFVDDNFVQTYNAQLGIDIDKSAVLYTFSMEPLRGVSDVTAQAWDIRVADIDFVPASVRDDTGYPAVEIFPDTNDDNVGVTSLTISVDTVTEGSMVHTCRKKRCPKNLMDYIDTSMATIHTGPPPCQLSPHNPV